uniref:Uncharacterized protein n=1 Tax=Lygus hesperus TaxID=30085 RepID=A0A146LYP3_LYGHE
MDRAVIPQDKHLIGHSRFSSCSSSSLSPKPQAECSKKANMSGEYMTCIAAGNENAFHAKNEVVMSKNNCFAHQHEEENSHNNNDDDDLADVGVNNDSDEEDMADEVLCPVPGLDNINYGRFSGHTAAWVNQRYPRLSSLLYMNTT